MSGDYSGLTDGMQQTLEQLDYALAASENAANADKITYDGFPKTIAEGKQGKHIKGHNNYQKGKSYLKVSMKEAGELVKKHSGKGEPITTNKERVDFGKTVGMYVDPVTGKEIPTTVGIIHYSKSGTHIVPARPKGAN